MKLKLLISCFIFLSSVQLSFGQNFFTSTTGGNWNLGTTWDATSCASGCVAGVDYPGPDDFAIIVGDGAGGGKVVVNGNYSVGHVIIAYDNASVLGRSGFSNRTLTIRGQLASYDFDLDDFAAPTAAIVENSSRMKLVFTGEVLDAGNDPVIFTWNHTATLNNATFSPPSSSTTLYTEGISMNGGNLQITNGNLRLNATEEIRDASGASKIIVDAGTELLLYGAVNQDGTTTSKFNEIDIDGAVSTFNTTGYLNVDIFNLNATGSLDVGFNGSNQTQGWYYQSTIPNTVNIDAASTITYDANAAQSVFCGTLGNLTLDAPASAATKTFTGTGNLVVQGDFTVNSSNVTVTSDQTSKTIEYQGSFVNDGTYSLTNASNNRVNFVGGANQSISGIGTTTFNQEVYFSNTADIDLDLTLSSTGHILDEGNDLSFSGDLTNNGTITSTGNFTFDGSASHSYGGTSATTFVDMTISCQNTFSNNGTIDITGSLTFSGSGTFDADGSGSGVLTLNSTGISTTARIASVPNTYTITGDLNVERFVSIGEDWTYLATPIDNANLGMWQSAGLPVTGNYSNADSGGDIVNSASESVYYYDAGTTTWTAPSSGGATSGVSLPVGRGHSIWTYNSSQNLTLVTTGTPNYGTTSITLTTSEDNLIGNPYPSSVSWTSVYNDNSGINAVASFRTSNNVFATWDASSGTGTNGQDGNIASGQSFWVNSGSRVNVVFEETHKSNSATFYRVEPAVNVFKVQLAQEEYSDEIILKLVDGASDDYDETIDGYKRRNGTFNLSSYGTDADKDMVVNGFHYENCSKTIKLKIADVDPGTYTLGINNLETFDFSADITIQDSYTGQTHTLANNESFSFVVDGDAASFGADRFTLTIGAKTINENLSFEVEENCGVEYQLTLLNAQQGVNYKVMEEDQTIGQSTATNDGELLITVSGGFVKEGDNSYAVLASSGTCGETLIDNALLVTGVNTPQVSNTKSGDSCGEGTVIISAEGAQNGEFYNWYTSPKADTPIANENSSELSLVDLNKSTTYYVAVASTNGCESEKVAVEAKIIELEMPEIENQGNLLRTQDTFGAIQWYKDNEPILGANETVYEVTSSGSYFVEVSSGSCFESSENVVMTINGIEDLKSKGIKIYPNPVVDVLNVELNKKYNGKDVRYKFYSVDGNLLYEGNEDQIDVSKLPQGVYFFNISLQNEVISFRIVK